jgi:acetyl-CoA carboxylase biotin carboxyl carrier protein
VDSRELRELIELISRSDFAEFEIEREGFKLKLVRAAGLTPQPAAKVEPQIIPAVAPQPGESPATAEPSAAATDNGLVDLISPIVGTFYTSASPDTAPFVEIGSHVNKGQVMCIVEAMKVMNEIEAEVDGEVAEVLVANGQPVEYGEVLFRMRPVG